MAATAQVTYSSSKDVIVSIDSSLSNKMCGACGNYNDNIHDDWKTADGKVAFEMSAIVGSWSAEDFSPW